MMKKQKTISRRGFLRRAGAATAGAIGFPYIVRASAIGNAGSTPASERTVLGFIGVGKQGKGLLKHFPDLPCVQVAAVCDVDRLKRQCAIDMTNEIFAEKTGAAAYNACDGYNDFRELLARNDIDGVVIATPDHTHAITSIQAMQNGKDVYCEKPLGNTIHDSRVIADTARRYDTVFQTGSMQRSWEEFRQACILVRNGAIGNLKQIKVCVGGPPIYCNLPAEPQPDYLDWDLWLGPAPWRPYHNDLSPHITRDIYPDWRRYWDFGGGSMTDLGAHMFDIAQWAMDMDRSGPVEIHPPDGKNFNVLTYRYANGVVMTEEGIPGGFGALFIGDKGEIEVNRQEIITKPDSIARIDFAHLPIQLYYSNDHRGNWIDCMRRRGTPICDAETGHRSATVCHLGNIAYRLNRPLKWNPDEECFINDPQADRLLERSYRSPWRLKSTTDESQKKDTPMSHIISRTSVIGILWCLLLSYCTTVLSQQRLWDTEPSLWQLAQRYTQSHKISPIDPQPLNSYRSGKTGIPRLSTQELKISLWGPPSQITLSLSKTDVWDRRCFQDPILTIGQIRQMVKEGKTPPYGSDAWRAYDAPGPKPVGQVILRCGDFDQAPQPTAVMHCDSGLRDVELHQGDAHAALNYLPMMTQNMIAIQCKAEGLKNPMSVRLYRHQDTIPYGKAMQSEGGPVPTAWTGYNKKKGFDYSKDANNGPLDPPTSGSDGAYFWIRQQLPAEKTFPDGFEYVLVARVVGSPVKMETTESQQGLGTLPDNDDEQKDYIKNKKPAWVLSPFYQDIRDAKGVAATATLPNTQQQHFTVLITVVTSAEADDPMAEAKRLLDQAARRQFKELVTDNLQWYEKFYQRREKGRIFKGDVEDTRSQIPEIFESWRCPHSGSCLPNPARYEADAQYGLLEQDWAPWHGLPCYNELYYTSTHVQNRSDRLTMWYGLVNVWLPACRKNAQEVFGLPGALIQHGYLPPVKPDQYIHTAGCWEFCMEISAQVLKVLWDAFDYGGDEQFLADSVYPAMREVAIFYSHYAEQGEDGFYHIIPTVSAEHWGWTDNFERNQDTTSALCMFRWLLNTTADASELLARDADLRDRWREVASKMAPYPTYDTPEGPVFTDVPGVDPIGVDYNAFAGVTPTLLADEINLDSTEKLKNLMLRTDRLVQTWESVQLPGVPVLLAQKKGFLPEQLINSRSGRIHLFPAITDGSSVAFRDMQARGGFEVSAESVHNKVTYVELYARRNVTCRLMNPWPNHPVSIIGDGKPVPYQNDMSNGDCLVFSAQKGSRYNISIHKKEDNNETR